MAKQPPIVEVEWEDAWSVTELTPFDNPTLKEPVIRRSVGYLLKVRPSLLLCASPYADFERGQDFTYIPRKLVRKMRVLKPDKDD